MHSAERPGVGHATVAPVDKPPAADTHITSKLLQIERAARWLETNGVLVTRDDDADAGNLAMFLDVNGDRRQTGNTATMIFSIPHIVPSISQFMTLNPGDVIPTGTPPGVALGMKPPRYLQPGDVVELGIEGLGQQRQTVLPEN